MRLALIAFLLVLPGAGWGQPAEPVPAQSRFQSPSQFLVQPYLQLGSSPALDALSLLWHASDQDAAWSVQVRLGSHQGWDLELRPTWVRVAVPTVEPHRVYTARLRPLVPGGVFTYQVLLDGRPVFRAQARARKGPGMAQRVAVAGDLATGGQAPKTIAWQMCRQQPDLVVVPGDIVYQDGRIPEYRKMFFPVFNADRDDPGAGAPLMRGTLVAGALGNHDVGERGPLHPWNTDPDGLAYYLYWDQPLNGPPLAVDSSDAPPLHPGRDWTWQGFLAAAGARFPTMGSFSFDSGDAHWTVLDSNPQVRWEGKALAGWLARDLEQAKGATWRFVVFHHPAFNLAAGNAYREQWMSRLWPVLEQNRVDLVFTGHIHTYVRSQPLRFAPDPDSLAALDPRTQQGEVAGKLDWDHRFDGKRHTRARGVIHIVTGGGGAPLHLKGRAAQLQIKPYVAKAILDEHSFSLLEIKGRRLTFRQLSAQGEELDRFNLTK